MASCRKWILNIHSFTICIKKGQLPVDHTFWWPILRKKVHEIFTLVWEDISKTRASGFIRRSKHLETIKALGRSGAFICFSVFGTPDKTLALVVDILLLGVVVGLRRPEVDFEVGLRSPRRNVRMGCEANEAFCIFVHVRLRSQLDCANKFVLQFLSLICVDRVEKPGRSSNLVEKRKGLFKLHFSEFELEIQNTS